MNVLIAIIELGVVLLGLIQVAAVSWSAVDDRIHFGGLGRAFKRHQRTILLVSNMEDAQRGGSAKLLRKRADVLLLKKIVEWEANQSRMSAGSVLGVAGVSYTFGVLILILMRLGPDWVESSSLLWICACVFLTASLLLVPVWVLMGSRQSNEAAQKARRLFAAREGGILVETACPARGAEADSRGDPVR